MQTLEIRIAQSSKRGNGHPTHSAQGTSLSLQWIIIYTIVHKELNILCLILLAIKRTHVSNEVPAAGRAIIFLQGRIASASPTVHLIELHERSRLEEAVKVKLAVLLLALGPKHLVVVVAHQFFLVLTHRPAVHTATLTPGHDLMLGPYWEGDRNETRLRVFI